MSDQEPTEQELAEAAALARALEHEAGGVGEAGDVGETGEAGEADAPQDALQSAALLRHVTGEGELSPQQADRIFDGLPQVGAPPAFRFWRRRLQLVGGLAAAAAAVLILTVPSPAPEVARMEAPSASRPSAAPAPPVRVPDEAAALPAPGPALLSAQAAAAKDAAALSAYEGALRPYRRRVMASLRNAYPQQYGMLGDRGRTVR